MKDAANLLIQFLGYFLQTMPMFFLYILTILEIRESKKWKKYIVWAVGINLLSGIIFVCLCWFLDREGLPWQYCNVYMTIIIFITFFWFWKVSGLNLYYVIILEILFIHYSAIIYTIDGIYINCVNREIDYISLPYSVEDIFGYLISNLCLFPVFVYFLKKRVFKNLFTMDRKILQKTTELVLLVILFYCASISYADWENLDIWNILLMIVIMITDVVLYYVFFHIIELSREKKNTEMQLLFLKNQQEKIKKNMEIARRIRHDNRHHIHIIERLLEEKNYEELKSYVESYEMSIRQEETKQFCSYMVADELLKYYSMIMKNEKIELETKFENVGDNYPFNPADLTIIIGNCLENAVEECKRLPNGQKRNIFFRMKQTRGNILLMEIKNTCRKNEKRGKEFEDYLRREEHGIGLVSVRTVLAKYCGDMCYWKKDGIFTIHIILPMVNALYEDLD